MGLLGKFLNRLTDERPDLAQEVLDREFGTLRKWMSNRECGCLVGTIALGAGYAPVDPFGDLDGRHRGPVTFLTDVTEYDRDYLESVGLQTLDIARRLSYGPQWRNSEYEQVGPWRQDEAIVVHLIRQRIGVRLAVGAV